MDEDCVFRYRLPGDARRRPIHSDPLAEMVREQLCNLLDIVQPLSGESEVALDGFRYLGPERRPLALYDGLAAGSAAREPGAEGHDPDGEGGAGPCVSLDNAALYEPRIEFIARQLASLLSVVELESGGEVVKVDGFRLKRLEDWVGPHAGTPADVFNHAATRCQYDCVFCYNRGAPRSLDQPHRQAEEEWKSLQARVGHWSPRAGRGLFPTFGSPREALAHPFILPLLRALREKSDAPFRISTNGGALRREFIASLAELAPLYLEVSLNSSSPARRSLLMGDRHPETAIRSLPLLAGAGIPFAVTVVAWPYPSLGEMLADLESTARYAWESGARLIQVNLPGYSRFFSPHRLFDTAEVWGKTVRAVQRLREETDCPLVTSPSLFEENLTRPRLNLPEVIGVVRNSPLARWGLLPGDTVTAVNGIAVDSRPQARELLTLLQESGQRRASLSVRRDGRAVELEGDTSEWAYPFDPATGTHLGAVFMGTGLRTSYLEKLQALIRSSGAREVLFLTSALVRPTLEQLLREHPLSLPEDTRLTLGVPENRFFGGNIVLGDLLVVQDFIDFLRHRLRNGDPRPDLVVIPSTPFHLSRWGRDLTGRPYLDISREAGIPVKLLECHPIWE